MTALPFSMEMAGQPTFKSCKSCLKVGCPAISMENGKAFIDRTQCVGCTVCAQACPFDAIEKEEK